LGVLFIVGTDSLARLLELLSDGQLHSGASLGEALGISRAGVWKRVHAARAMGIPLNAQRGGYRLPAGFDLLVASKILEQCSAETRRALAGIDLLWSIDSTNSHVMRCYQQGEAQPVVVLAEQQTAGRGRRGRVWHSPLAGNIYLSLGWVFTEGLAAIEGLSLVVGLKVLEVLEQFGATGLQLKWPNDICWHQRKLAGILVDVQGDPSGICQVATGIGINVNMPKVSASQIDQPWVDLVTVLGGGYTGKNVIVSRNTLVAALLDQLVPVFQSLPEKGFASYRQAWQQYDLCYGQPVCLLSGTTVLAGIGQGINAQGAYALRVDRAGEPSALYYASGGEISLRLPGAIPGRACT
jgi:BirA family biotin operon repressor/biotin-[acetyl-CoA-carboxylase] ligase